MSAAPTPYIQIHSYTGLAEIPYTETGLPGGQLDAEFSTISVRLTATQSRLAEIQRDDGAIRNGSVGFSAMSADVLAAFSTIGSNYRGAWVSGQTYLTGDLVILQSDNYPYLCGYPHTSSASFESDFSAGSWAILGFRPSTQALVVNNFSGNGAATEFTLTKNPVSSSNTQVYVSGVYQKKSSYIVTGTTLTFAAAPASGTNNIEVVIGVSAEILNNVVTIPNLSVGTGAIIDLNVTGNKIADGSITSGKIADGGVSTSKIADLSVTSAKLANLSVTSNKLGGASIDSTKMAVGSVQTAAIQDGAVTAGKLADGSVTGAKLAASAMIPAGAVMAFMMNSVPLGWLAADGSEVSRTTYAPLYSLIADHYGAGDGSTTFNLPDLRGYFIRGYGGNADGTWSGSFGDRQGDDLKSHQHAAQRGLVADAEGGNSTLFFDDVGRGVIMGDPTGGAETRPKNIAMLYCIKI